MSWVKIIIIIAAFLFFGGLMLLNWKGSKKK